MTRRQSRWLTTERLIHLLTIRKQPSRWRTLLRGRSWAVVIIRDGQGRTFKRAPGE